MHQLPAAQSPPKGRAAFPSTARWSQPEKQPDAALSATPVPGGIPHLFPYPALQRWAFLMMRVASFRKGIEISDLQRGRNPEPLTHLCACQTPAVPAAQRGCAIGVEQHQSALGPAGALGTPFPRHLHITSLGLFLCCPLSPQCSALKEELRKEEAQRESRQAQEKELKLCRSVS